MKVESSFVSAVVVGVTTTSSSFNLLAVIAAVANAPVAHHSANSKNPSPQ